jgi:hypothetical protein
MRDKRSSFLILGERTCTKVGPLVEDLRLVLSNETKKGFGKKKLHELGLALTAPTPAPALSASTSPPLAPTPTKKQVQFHRKHFI